MNTEKVRILFLHNQSGISGGERSLLNLWRRLDRERFTPCLILPRQGLFSAAAEEEGLEVGYIDVPAIRPGNILRIFRALAALVKYIRAKKIDVIHSYSPRNNFLGAIAGRLSGIPVIWHERNLIYGDEADLSRKYIFLPDAVICNSLAVAERFREKGAIPSKIRVITNGVDLEEFNPRADAAGARQALGAGDRKIVGTVSNLGRRKRVEHFLEAASILGKTRSDVLFVITGGEFPEGSGRMRELKSEADKMGLGGRVEFTGFSQDTASILAGFDVFVHATLKEACSRAIIEAMAAGKPVVAMDSGGNPEIVENGVTGVLVPSRDISALVKAIEGLLDDPAARKEMGKKGRARAEKLFDVSRNAAETERLYLDLREGGML